MPEPPDVISLDPKTIGEVLGDVRTRRRGDRPHRGRRRLHPRAPAAGSTASGSRSRDAPRPSAAAVEWFDPVYVGRALDAAARSSYAGGEDVLGNRRRALGGATWEDVAAAAPDVVVLHAVRLRRASARGGGASPSRSGSRRSARGKVVAVDAAALLLAPGPAAARRPRAARPPLPPRARARAPGPAASSTSPRCSRHGDSRLTADHPVPALLGRPLRRRPSTGADRNRPGPRSLPRARRPARARRARRGPPRRRGRRARAVARGPAPRADVAARDLAGHRGVGGRRGRSRPAGARGGRRGRPHQHVGDTGRGGRRADRGDPPRVARARDLRGVRALVAGLPAAAVHRRRAPVRVAGDARAVRGRGDRQGDPRRPLADRRPAPRARRRAPRSASTTTCSSRRCSAGSRAGRARRSSRARWRDPLLADRGAVGLVAGAAWRGEERHERALRELGGRARARRPPAAARLPRRPRADLRRARTSSSCPRRSPTRCPTRRSRRPRAAAASSPRATAGCRRSCATERRACSSRRATRWRWRTR